MASKFCSVLLTLQSYTTGKTEYYLKASIKSLSGSLNSAQLAYRTLLRGIERTMGEVGKENEKVLFIERKISTIIHFNLFSKVINPYISGAATLYSYFS